MTKCKQRRVSNIKRFKIKRFNKNRRLLTFSYTENIGKPVVDFFRLWKNSIDGQFTEVGNMRNRN